MRKKGFTIIELLVALGVIGFIMALFSVAIKEFRNYERIQHTKEVIKTLNFAIEKTFIDNAREGQNCYSWNDGLCASLTLTPVQIDDTTIQFNVYDNDIVNALKGVGCIVNGNLPNFTVQCYDGFGKLLKFQTINEHDFGQTYVVPYTGDSFKLVVKDSIGNSYVIDTSKLFSQYLTESKEKLYTIAEAVRKYVQTKRELELANVCDDPGQGDNDPAGGLGSWDDALVPWIWEAVSSTENPLTLCSGVEDDNSKCGCSNFSDTSIWSNDDNLCELDTGDEMQRFLRNINLDITYWSDGFGNPITVVPLADNNGNPLGCPPPRPQPNYPLVVLPKTRVGVKGNDNTWAIFIDIVNE
jgi:prepilin-type N-terminal cleavage/methylation domain-containing protein